MLLDAAHCHVFLHGFSETGNTADYYIGVYLNGVKYRNRPIAYWETNGLTTYIVDPSNCTASDIQFFNTNGVTSESTRLINYLQALADGMSLFSFLSGWIFRCVLYWYLDKIAVIGRQFFQVA